MHTKESSTACSPQKAKRGDPCCHYKCNQDAIPSPVVLVRHFFICHMFSFAFYTSVRAHLLSELLDIIVLGLLFHKLQICKMIFLFKTRPRRVGSGQTMGVTKSGLCSNHSQAGQGIRTPRVLKQGIQSLFLPGREGVGQGDLHLEQGLQQRVHVSCLCAVVLVAPTAPLTVHSAAPWISLCHVQQTYQQQAIHWKHSEWAQHSLT